MDICVKNPGATHDASVLTGSRLYRNVHTTMPKSSVQVDGRQVPYVLLGRLVVENAFGRIKARSRRLLKQCDLDHKFVPKPVAACCTLHDFIEIRKVGFNMMQDVENAEIFFPKLHSTGATSNRDSFEAHNLRKNLCNYLTNNTLLRASRQII
nr:unnamed protein product [Callosobruchus analis]